MIKNRLERGRERWFAHSLVQVFGVPSVSDGDSWGMSWLESQCTFSEPGRCVWMCPQGLQCLEGEASSFSPGILSLGPADLLAWVVLCCGL